MLVFWRQNKTMKNITKIALLVALGGGAIVPALAQDNFPDVPENHWAFEALDNLKKEGIVVGYPDGRYRGTRFMTRYEFAVAINAAYKKLMSMYSGLSARVDALEKGQGQGGTVDLSDIKADIARMKGWGDDIASLQKMAGTFEKQLASLGVDVEQLKKDLKECSDHCKGMGGGGTGLPFSVSGDVNAMVISGNGRNGYSDLNKGGGVYGPGGLTRNHAVYHEIGLHLASNGDSNVKWHADLAFGNALDGLNTQSGAGTYTNPANFDVYVNELSASFNDSLLGLGFGAEVGRVGVKIAPYILQRPDYTAYTDLARWDDGTWKIDGAKVGFNFGGVKLGVVAGTGAGVQGTNTAINPIPALNGVAVKDILAVTANFNLGKIFTGTAAYVWHDNGLGYAGTTPNRATVFGVDGTLNVANLAINGGYAESKISQNTHSLTLDNNKSMYANTNLKVAGFGVGLEYRKVEKNYAAAGAWRRIGTNWNPTDIQTITGTVGYKLSNNLSLNYSGEFGDHNVSATKHKLESHNVTADYQFNANWKVKLGYEDVKVKDYNLRQKWATLGLGYNLGPNTTFGFAYEYGSASNGGGLGAAWGGSAINKGGFFSSQLSIKF